MSCLQPDAESPLRPHDYLRIFQRRWLAVAAVVLIGAAVAWVTAPDGPEPDRFRASTIVAVQSTSNVSGATLAPLSPDIAAQLLVGGDIPRRVAQSVGHSGDPQQLARQIATATQDRGNQVVITAVTTDGEVSATLANAFAQALIDFDAERTRSTIEGEIARRTESANALVAQIGDIDARIESTTELGQLSDLAATRTELESRRATIARGIEGMADYLESGLGRISLAVEAFAVKVAPSEGFGPPRNPVARAALAGGLGLLVGGALALFLDRTDRRIQDRRQVEGAFRLKVVAEIPEVTANDRNSYRVITHTQPRSATAEAYRSLRTAISLMPLVSGHNLNGASEAHRPLAANLGPPEPSEGGKVIVVTSPGPGEGKTSTVANLAASWAEMGASVLVVGGDTRRPMIDRYLGVKSQSRGLSDAIRESLDPAGLARLVHRTAVPGVYLLTSGTELLNPASILEAEHDIMRSCRRMADIVIIDTPPVLVANDALELMVRADAVILLVRVGQTTTDAAERAADLMLRVDAPVVGAALVGASTLPDAYGRYYRAYGYHDGPVSPPAKNGGAARIPAKSRRARARQASSRRRG